MHSTKLSTVSVNEGKKCLVKSGKDKDVNIPRQVSKHTLPFIFRYFAIYVDILFWGCYRRHNSISRRYPYTVPGDGVLHGAVAVVAVVAVILGPITATAAWNTGGMPTVLRLPAGYARGE